MKYFGWNSGRCRFQPVISPAHMDGISESPWLYIKNYRSGTAGRVLYTDRLVPSERFIIFLLQPEQIRGCGHPFVYMLYHIQRKFTHQ